MLKNVSRAREGGCEDIASPTACGDAALRPPRRANRMLTGRPAGRRESAPAGKV